jgi:7-cyano-7-deazaguanine synthase in queuosine biosynthesis
MANERSIICGDVTRDALPFDEKKPLSLRFWGTGENVSLRIGDIRSQLLKDIPSTFHDLVEIATYIYCADQAITRGGNGVDNFGENWRRRLFFRIAVRNPDLWNSSPLKDQLIETLSFLSEDEYYFDFVKLIRQPPTQTHLEFDVDSPEEVILFSGGLDSLGGAVEEGVTNSRKIVMVTHKPTHKLNRRHRKLLELLSLAATHPPRHISVAINKDKSLGKEYTQRSRSFLYAALGATVAQMFNLRRIRFYENGIISFNLPISAQVVGARATRTTHPQVINGFAKIFSTLSGKPFNVENPFLWKTKTEVIRSIAKAGCADTIKFATSCTHTWEMTKLHTHCGTCSQCIDRRFAILAAGAEKHDPKEAYGIDLLVGERDEGEPKAMMASYVETANKLADMSALEFFGQYGEAARVLKHLNGSPDATALQIYELHRRHAKYITKVVDDAIAQNRSAIRKRQLPPSCLLRLVCDSSGVQAGLENSDPTMACEMVDNYICIKGQCWAIRYNGNEEKIYTPDIGFYHLQILLENPGATFSASELDVMVRRMTKNELCGSVSAGETPTEEGVSVLGQSDAGPVLDEDAVRAYHTRLNEIEEEVGNARANNDLGKIDALESEKGWLESELANAKGRGGEIRKLGDDRNKVRNRVGNAIRRALRKIKQFDRPLSDHLQKPILNIGHTLSYIPRRGLIWSSTPNQNN